MWIECNQGSGECVSMQQARAERSLFKMRLFFRFQLTLCSFFLSLLILSRADAVERPNVVWIVVDDMSPNFSCYGETAIETPHVDRLAAEGVRFTRAYATSPVCSTFRSALITGMYQTATGTHHRALRPPGDDEVIRGRWRSRW